MRRSKKRDSKKKLRKTRKTRKQKGGTNKDTAYVINLKDRNDRKSIITNKFKDSSIELEFFQVERHPSGAHAGTGDSFMKVIQKAKDLNLPAVLIFEDDNMPLENFDSRWKKTKEWLDSNKDKWEIFNGGARIYDNPTITLKYKVNDDINLFEMSNFLGLNWIYINASIYDKALEWKIENDGPIDKYLGNNTIFKNLCIYPYLGLQEVGISNSWGKHMNLTEDDIRMKNIFQKELDSQKQIGGDNNTIYIKKDNKVETESLYPFLKNIYPNKTIEFVDNRDTYDLIIFGCNDGISPNQPHIIICGESYQPITRYKLNDPNCVAYFLSNQHPDTKNIKNYYYFPLFLTIGHEIYNSSPFIRKYNHYNKTRLCAFVARNETEQRTKLFNALKVVDITNTVDGLGNALHNKDIVLPQFWWDLPEIYKDYKFMFAIENTDEDGYISEKIMNGYRASCIPIYWGTSKVKEIFNPESFIYINDYKKADNSIDYEACAKDIIAISKDKNRYNKMITAPIFKEVTEGSYDFAKYYDTPSPQWVLDISNEIKQRLNIQKGGNNLNDITMGILSWKSCKTLQNSLESYKKNNLLNLINTFIYFQEIGDVEKKLGDSYSIPYIGTDKNIGIQKALIEMINNTKTKYFIFAENDFELIHNKEETQKVFEDCINLLENNDVQIVKLRDIQKPGEPVYSQYTYENDFKDKPNQQEFSYKLEALSYIDSPEETFPNVYTIINYNYKWYKCSNIHSRWSNNIFIAKTDWLKNNVIPLIDRNKNNTKNIYIFENNIIENLKNYNVAAGMGLFTHNRLERGGCSFDDIKVGGKKSRIFSKTRKNKKQKGGQQNPTIHCITVSTQDNDKLQRLLNSAKRYNISIDVLGLDLNTSDLGHNNKAKFGMKLGLPLEYIKKVNENDIILFTDAWDVIYIDNLDNMYEKYKKFNKPIVFGAELFSWPDESKASEYIDTQNEYFKYLNSGLYMGTAGIIKQMLSNYKGGEDIDDQRFWVDLYLKNTDKIALDTKAELFLDAAGTDKTDYEFSNNKFIFKKTNTSPSIIHANSSDKTYLDLFIQKCGNNSNKQITYVINLKERTDRKQQMIDKFNNTIFDLKFIEAIKNDNGFLGCSLSIQKVVQKAKDLNLKTVLIFEDDNKPLDNYKERWNIIKKWLDNNLDKWDIFNGSPNILKKDLDSINLIQTLDNKIHLFQSDIIHNTNWIYINNKIYDKILNWKLKDYPNTICIDSFMGDKKYFTIFFTFPFLSLQESGKTNTEKNIIRNYSTTNSIRIDDMQIIYNKLTNNSGGKEITWFLPAYVPFVKAGAEYMAHAINLYLIKEGYKVNVVGPWEAQTIEGINYINSGDKENIDKVVESSNALFAQQTTTFSTLSLAKEKNKKVVIVVHNMEKQFYDLDKFKTLIDPTNIFLVFNSQWIRNHFNTDISSMILYPPVNCHNYKTETSHEYVTLINVSDLKGGNQLIEIAKQMPDIQFLGVEGGYDEQIKDTTVSNIKYIPNTQTIKDVYAQTDILIMPSSSETWGRTATEALCSGIPVLATPTDGLKENLGDAGIFINRDSINEWVSTIRKLKDDRNYYNSISQKCKERSDELSSNTEKQLKELLNNLI